ncbi:MAG: hypothetical protein JKY81_01610 [Colwellia sp.]|nr:hypothetical protein [Colwellia sp.]
MIRVTLPYPPAKLNPNKRLHWAVKAKAVKAYRHDCYLLAKSVMFSTRTKAAICAFACENKLPIKIIFHYPDKRRRDRDNAIASFKAGADGVADAIGVDDADWTPTYLVGDVVKGGAVVIKIGI